MDTTEHTYLDVTVDITPTIFRPASRKIIWWAIGRWLAAFDVALLLVLLMAWLLRASLPTVVVIVEVGAFGLFALFIVIAIAPRARRTRAMNEGRMRFLAREDGYTVEGPFGAQTIRWSTYKKAYVDKRFIYLMLSNRMGQVIPLAHVADPQPLLDQLRKLGLLRNPPKTFLVF